jgi:hypothetical protein
MLSGKGVVEKRELSQAQQIFQYTISVGKRFKVDFELPSSISTLQNGQNVKVIISVKEPKTQSPLLTLRGEVYEITKTKEGSIYILFFSGLQGRIQAKRAFPFIKSKKPIFISII